MALMRTGGGLFTRRMLLTSAAILLTIAPSQASVMRFLTIEELAGSSSQVVRARITGQTTHWTPNHEGIYTEIATVVLGDLKWAGGPAQGPRAGERHLTIIQAGGTIDGISLDWTGRPNFNVGEDLVLFLAPYEPADSRDTRLLIVGGKQGRMRVISDSRGNPTLVERDLQGVLDAPLIEGDVPAGPAPRRDQMTFDEVRNKVRTTRGGVR